MILYRWLFFKSVDDIFESSKISTLNLIQDLGLSSWFFFFALIARWIESLFALTGRNMISACDFHGIYIIIRLNRNYPILAWGFFASDF